MARKKPYTGPVCYVGHDHEAADGRPLAGGWHHTVIEGPEGHEMPGEPLVHEDDSYRFATAADMSHHERHHKQYVAIVPSLSDEEKQRLRELLDAQQTPS